jgi:hypothetical protein
MSNRIDLDVHFLEQEIANLIASYPEMEEDDSLKADMIEGSLDAEKVMSRIMSHLFEAEEMLDGMKPRFEDLTERKKRWERRKEFCRALAQRVLEASGRDKIVLPEASVAKSKGRDSIEVTDLSKLSQGFYVTERKADKDAIKKALDNGDDVEGARIVRGAYGIRISTK